MADDKFHDNDIMDAECLKLFSPSNKMTEKQLNRAMDYLNNLLQKPAQEIMKNPVQVVILLKYMDDTIITEDQKKKVLGKDYDFWKVLLEEKNKAEKKITSAEKIRENNPNLEVEVNNEEKEEENKMAEEKKEVQQQEMGVIDTLKANAVPIGAGIAVGIGAKVAYDHFTKPDASYGSVAGDMVETVSAFTDEF